MYISIDWSNPVRRTTGGGGRGIREAMSGRSLTPISGRDHKPVQENYSLKLSY